MSDSAGDANVGVDAEVKSGMIADVVAITFRMHSKLSLISENLNDTTTTIFGPAPSSGKSEATGKLSPANIAGGLHRLMNSLESMEHTIDKIYEQVLVLGRL